MRTVDVHVSRILRKLGAASRRDLARWARARGLCLLALLLEVRLGDWVDETATVL
jgi:hypothetical protein